VGLGDGIMEGACVGCGVIGIPVGLEVGSVDGRELGDGLGIKDGLLLGASVGAPVSGHGIHISVK